MLGWVWWGMMLTWVLAALSRCMGTTACDFTCVVLFMWFYILKHTGSTCIIQTGIHTYYYCIWNMKTVIQSTHNLKIKLTVVPMSWVIIIKVELSRSCRGHSNVPILQVFSLSTPKLFCWISELGLERLGQFGPDVERELLVSCNFLFWGSCEFFYFSLKQFVLCT